MSDYRMCVEADIKDDHLPHIVAFHAQQAVEKCFTEFPARRLSYAN